MAIDARVVVFAALSTLGHYALSDANFGEDAAATFGQSNEALQIRHSLDEGVTFETVGTITLSGSKSQGFEDSTDYESTIRSKLQRLCSGGNDFYLMSVASSDVELRAVGDACSLAEAGAAVFTFNTDWRGQLMAFSVTPDVQTAKTSSTFTIRSNVQAMEAGPQPDTAAFIQKMEEEKLAKQRGETKDNRSFFAK